MTNIKDFDPDFLWINDFKGCKDGSTVFNSCYCEEKNDKLTYNQKINVPVCVISMSSVLNKRDWYYPQIKLRECFYENYYLDEKEK